MGCVFCGDVQIIFENDLAFAIYDKFPVNEGHMLVIPRRQVASFFETTSEEKACLLELVEKVREFIFEKFRPDGLNVGINDGTAAGQTGMHLHVHLIPRFLGDVEDPRGGVRGAVPGKRVY